MSEPAVLFHGGAAGLRPGDVIVPGMAEHRFVDGCEICAAHARGESTTLDPLTPHDWVYATTDRPYARYYASRAVKGTLYRVRLEGDIEQSTEDEFPTWRARRGVVVSVLERRVQLTMRERRRLFIRWGGTPREFNEMLAAAAKGEGDTP